MDGLMEIIAVLIGIILAGLGYYSRRAHLRIDDMSVAIDKSVQDLDRRKANNEDVQEMKRDIKEILTEIKKFEVDTARWQGQMEGRDSNKLD